MSILDLKSNLSNFRKPTTVKEQEKQKLKESPIIKTVYSTSNTLKNTSDIKINKVDNSTSIQVLGAKKIDYKLFSINTSRGRGIPSISTLFGKAVLDKESLFKKFTPGNIVKVSEYKEQRPVSIPKESNFVKITPIGIQHISTFNAILTILKNKVSLYKEQFPRALPKISQYIDQSPRALLKLSLYIDQMPRPLSKLSLYIDQLPRLLSKLSLYKDQRPNILDKLSLYKKLAANGFDDLQSGAKGFTLYQTATQYLGLDTSALEYIYPKTVKFGRLNDRLSFTGRGLSGFDDLQSGAKGFTLYQKELGPSNFLGINGDIYTYPKTVREGRLKDKTKIKGAEQWPSKVSFGSAPYSTVPSNNPLYDTTYNRTTYSITKPYLTSTGITGDDLRTYFTRTNSPSARDKIYTKFNLQTASWNPFSFGPAFNQPLILRGIQREKDGELARGPQSWGFENNFDDGLIRGGTVGSTERAIFDVLRIGKWMASPKGLLFLVKQAGLQASAPNTEADPFVGARAGNGALTLISSLANTATQHLGIRFRKDAFPFVPRKTYSSVIFGATTDNGRGITPVTQQKDNNRLNKLYKSIIEGLPSVPNSILGGPQSVYGIGVTRNTRVINSRNNLSYKEWSDISRTSVLVENLKNKFNEKTLYKTKALDNEPITLSEYKSSDRFRKLRVSFNALNYNITPGINGNYYTLTYENLLDRKTQIDEKSTTIYNFLLNVNGTAKNPDVKWIPTKGKFIGTRETVIQDYTETSQHQRTKLSVPDYGKRGKDLRNPLSGSFMNKYTPGGPGMADPIWKVNQLTAEEIDDFVKFIFHDVNTNEKFRFRAYIENVSEDFTPDWQEVKILGRADSPYIYQGFSRTVQIAFKVAALSRGDLMLMWDQLERLARTTVPKYSNTYKMVGPLIKFTLGNWFSDTPAYIRSLSYSTDNETSWEINLEESELYDINANENSVGQLPMVVSVQLTLQIFGDVRPESLIDDINTGGPYNTGNLYPLGIDGLRKKRQGKL